MEVKRGRKPKMNKLRHVAIYITPEEKKELEAAARAEDRTLSSFLRRLVLAGRKKAKQAEADDKSSK